MTWCTVLSLYNTGQYSTVQYYSQPAQVNERYSTVSTGEYWCGSHDKKKKKKYCHYSNFSETFNKPAAETAFCKHVHTGFSTISRDMGLHLFSKQVLCLREIGERNTRCGMSGLASPQAQSTCGD